jgi:hypothetical protein
MLSDMLACSPRTPDYGRAVAGIMVRTITAILAALLVGSVWSADAVAADTTAPSITRTITRRSGPTAGSRAP